MTLGFQSDWICSDCAEKDASYEDGPIKLESGECERCGKKDVRLFGPRREE